MSRLLLVAHRLPFTLRDVEGATRIVPSIGGLATALSRVHARSSTLWLGCANDAPPPQDRERLSRDLECARTIAIDVPPIELARYYDGFSNGVLWPLFHYLLDKVHLDAEEDWRAYVAVNERFSDVVARHWRPGDRIWIHDYQLTLLPALLRKRLPTARIGFFLHVPFPAADVFRILPWREQILRGLLDADLIGFHTDAYRRHFAESAAHVLGAEVEDAVVVSGMRRVRLGVFPIGADAEEISALAMRGETLRDAASLREGTGVEKLILGVDRLDYTKGLTRRLLAFERLLERHPEWIGRVRFVQVAVPSRERVRAYEEFRSVVDVTASRINGRFGSVKGVPIHLLHRPVPLADLVALYRAADVMAVTPLRDGMNLVAKEYCAARVDDDGVLVLSEFAGAAADLAEALIVNPYDLTSTAAAMHDALTMDPDERARRMRGLRQRVLTDDVHAWTDAFLSTLGEGDVPDVLVTSARLPQAVEESLTQADHLVLFLDYDGTLVPFAPTPLLAAPDVTLRELIARLAIGRNVDIHFVSGRPRETLDAWFQDWPIHLHAEHGFWSRRDQKWSPLIVGPFPWKASIRRILEDFRRAIPGTLIEEKTASLAWHFRGADPTSVNEQLPRVRDALEELAEAHGVDVLNGAKVIEVRPRGVSKGAVVERELASIAHGAQIVAIGDDATDEDMFRTLPATAITIRVGVASSVARYRLQDVTEVRQLLQHLVVKRPHDSAGVGSTQARA